MLTTRQLRAKGKLDIVCDLLCTFVEDYIQYKNKVLEKTTYPLLYQNKILEFCEQISKYYSTTSQEELVIEYYKKGEEIYLSAKGEKEIFPRAAWDGYVYWAKFYLERSLQKEALKKLDQYETCHDNHHAFGTLLELHLEIAYSTRDFMNSDRVHLKRREWNGEKTLNELENIPYKNIEGIESNDVEEAAEAIIVYHHMAYTEIAEKNERALYHLDRLLKEKEGEYNSYSYEIEFLENRMLPELGAYLGEVLINELAGQWDKGTVLMQSRVILKNQIINPFEEAFNVLFLGHRLNEDIFYRIKNDN